MEKKILVLLCTIFCGFFVFAQKPDSDFHIYVLMGQSNMAGWGKITDEFK